LAPIPKLHPSFPLDLIGNSPGNLHDSVAKDLSVRLANDQRNEIGPASMNPQRVTMQRMPAYFMIIPARLMVVGSLPGT
jgi:hypothetical protein